MGHRKGAVNKAGKSDSNAEAARKSLGSAIFPDEESEEGIFHQEVLYSVQRWFSAHGWPGGSYPIRIPESLRRCVFIVNLDFAFIIGVVLHQYYGIELGILFRANHTEKKTNI